MAFVFTENNHRHYNGIGATPEQELEPASVEEQERMRNILNQFSQLESIKAADAQASLTPAEHEVVDEALNFLERETGLTSSCAIEKAYSTKEAQLGRYALLDHSIKIYYQGVGDESADKKWLGNLLVHELAHSTAFNTTTAITIDTTEGGVPSLYRILPHHVAPPITLGMTHDHFFEEGLAEHMGSRWRMETDENLKEVGDELFTPSSAEPLLPLRMYASIDPETKKPPEGEVNLLISAYCAYGIQLLSEYTKVDPNLYEFLTTSGSDAESFALGLRVIQELTGKDLSL